MSSIAPSARAGWRLLPAVIAVATAVIAASLLIAVIRSHPLVAATGAEPGALGPDVAAAAVWRTDSFPVGASGKLTKTESARFLNQKDRVRATVRDLSDALVVDPARLRRAAGRVMSAPARTSLLELAPTLPKGAEAITVMKRTGRIGIQAPAFAAAAARMKIVMNATIDGRTVSWRDDFTFWLHRSQGSWQVIAFDVDRTPLQ